MFGKIHIKRATQGNGCSKTVGDFKTVCYLLFSVRVSVM